MSDNTPVVSGQNVGKSIGQLTPITSVHQNVLGQFVIPTEYGGTNYKVSVFEIVSSVTKQSLGLERVDNTSDAEKPLSSFVIQEFLKYWKRTDTIPQSSIESLVGDLNNKRSTSEPVPIQDVQGLSNILNNKLDRDGSIQIGQVTGLPDVLDNKASSVHNHQLVELDGWTNFINGLQQSLFIRPTETRVTEMIDEKIEEGVGVDVNRLIVVNEQASDWE